MRTTSSVRSAAEGRAPARLAAALVLVLGLAAASPALAAGHPPGGLTLPGGLMLNGRFDAAYERTGYSNNLSDGENGLANYHHFVFLSRQAKSDPLFFSAEIVDLSFYEAGARFAADDGSWNFKFKVGKLMVPFGPDPLFHHQYGGLSGFDQQIFPVVWANLGGAVAFQYYLKPIRLQAEAYVVRGYELAAEDAVLRLNGDFSSLGAVRPGVGGRFSASWGPATLYYSAYANPLGFSRNLFMQAVDLTIWRIPDVPVLEDLALMVGFMRADVTGGDQPDYYHFGDYVEVRYFPVDNVWIQYRGGLKTLDNRQGLFQDDRRFDEDDSSAHTVGVWAAWYGFTFGLQHVWRLEKANEKDNDFLRLTVAYEF